MSTKKQQKFNQQNSKFILEELEERRLFSGGIEGLIVTGLDSDENAIYADADANKSQTTDTQGATTASAAEQQSQEIVFVDAGVDNHQQLVDDLRANSDASRNIEVVVLDREQDGIQQISDVLQDRDDLDAIHIISHGGDGNVELGNASLNNQTLQDNNLSIALWANAFAETGDILVYGCNLAGSEAGQSLIADLGGLTLTDVTASDDLTGHTSLGGDWELEHSVGTIETEIAFSASVQQAWQEVLAPNSAPVNTVPGAQTIDQNGMLLFSSTTGTAVSVTDADAGGSAIEVTLNATNGTLNLSGDQGLSFSTGDGSADTTMTFTGTIADINAALEGMTFAATPGFTGAANLEVITDDLGNTGTGGAQSDTDNVAITVVVPDHTLWMTFENDEAATGNAELPDFTGGDVVNYGGTLTFESGTTSGTFSKNFNLDLIAGTDGDTRVDAVHYMTRDINVGGIDLQTGDLLLSTDNGETIDGVSYAKEDVFVFRPTTAGDYSSGSFFMLIAGNSSGLLGNVTGISMVEQDTDIGGTIVNAGDFLLAHDGSGKDVIRFEADQLGDTTSGTTSVLVAGADIDIGQNIGALHLVQEDTAIGDATLQAGQLIVGLTGDDSAVGDAPTIDVLRQDMFVLDVSATGVGTTAATATRFFEGLDENLDENNEGIWGASAQYNVAPTFDDATFALNENSAKGTVVGSVTATDPESGTLNYAITAGNTDGAFAINAATGQITVANSAVLDFEVNKTFQLDVVAIDDKGAHDTATVVVNLNNLDEAGTNDAPENAIPADQTINKDGLLLFSSANGTAISVSDFDAGGSPIQITLVATNGTLNLSGTQGLSFTVGDGTADSIMTFTGTIADINAALEGSTFVANPGFIGSAALQITTDDQGNTGTGGALSDTDNITINVQAEDHKLWLTFENDEAATGNSDIPSITGGDVVTFGDITQLETSNTDPLASTTSGSMAYGFNLNTVLLSDGLTQASDGDTIVNAVHYVTQDIQVGSNSIQLQTGDVLLSTDRDETIDGVTYDKEDVFVFRPDTYGDYSQGSFFLLIDGNSTLSLGNLTAISLVEQDTDVAGVTLSAGEFLFAHDGDSKTILRYVPGTLGAATTGTASILVDGNDIDIGQKIGGLHLVQNDTEIGGIPVTAGQMLVSLQGNDTTVGDAPTIDVLRQDMFLLDVSATGVGTTAATATRFFEGLDESLDDNAESIWGIGYQGNVAPTINADTFAIDEDSINGTVVGSVTASDPENSTLNYAIMAGNTNGAFTIDASGQITVANSNVLDFETTPSFALTVAAIDASGAYDTAIITVDLNNVNDAPVLTAWFNDAWETRKGLTIDAASVAGDVTNFPVLITLNTDAELAAQALANGDDIVFTAADGVTQLAHEIEFFDETTGELRVWVKTDLSGSVDTDIYMYFGNAASGPQENIPGVWDNYVGVYHLGESPNGTSGEITDSSGSGNHGTTEGAMDAADTVSTTIGQGLAFDGANDLIRIPNSASLDGISDEATFSLWINYVDAADGQHQIVMTSEDRFSATDGYEWASNGAGEHFFYPDATTPDGNYNVGNNPFTNGDWHHLAATMDFVTREVKIYVNGTPMTFTSEGVPGNWTETTTSTADLLWGGNPDRAERFFLGMMDEIRIADVARSQEWLQTEYNNQKTPGTFFSLGVSEDREDKLTDINEDDLTSAGDSVLSIINSSGADRITDEDTGALEGIAVTAADNTNGQWQYDANADGSWLAFGSVSDTNAVLLDTGALIRFVPNADYNGSAGDLTFHAWDQTSGANGDIGVDVSTNGGNTAYSSETFDATLNVLPVDDAAVFTGDISGTENEGVTVTGTLTATDVDGLTDGTYFSITGTLPANGTAAIDPATGAWSFTPTDPNWFGSDSFEVTVTDDEGGTTTQTINVTLTNVDDAAVIGGDISGTENEGVTVTGTLTATDVDGLTDGTYFSITGTLPANGTAAIDPATGAWSFTPTDPNWFGSDSFEVTVTDDQGGTTTQIINVTLTNVDDPAVIGGDISGTENEGVTVTGTLTATDADGLTDGTYFTITGTLPANGTAAIDPATGAWSFTPTDSNWFGSDSFEVTVTDDQGGTTTQIINVTLTNVDDAAVIGGDISGTENEGVTVTGTLTATDADGLTDGTYFTITGTLPTNGTAAIDPTTGAWSFTPTDPNWFGSDSFEVTVTDDEGGTTTQIINVTLTNVDDAAVIGGDISGTENEGVTVTGTLTATDADGLTDGTYFTITGTLPTNGTAAIDPTTGAWSFTPNDPNWFGSDSFEVTVTDDQGGTTTQIINVTLTNVDDPAVIGGDTSGTENEGVTVTGTLTATDADGLTDGTYFTITGTLPTNGTAAIDPTTGAWSFTPTDPNWFGSDSFEVTVTDDQGGTTTQIINVTLTNVDDPAVIGGDVSGTENEGVTVTGTLTATDVDGLTDGTYFSITGTLPTNGTAAIDPATGAWSFTPTDPNWFGSDSFEVTVTDDQGGTTTQVVNVTLTNVDDPAVIGGDTSGTENEGMTVTGTLTATDADGLTDGTYFSITGTLPTNGTAAIDPATGAWSFTPTDPNWFGTDSFEVTVTDDQGGTTTQIINVALTNVDDPAVIGGDTSGTENEGVTVTGTLTATDADGLTDGTYFTITGTLPTNGTAAIDPTTGAWSFTPTDPNWFGSDSFEVTVTDDQGGTTTQIISITLVSVNDPAVIGGVDTGSVTEDVAVVANNISTGGLLTIADPDVGESTFQAGTVNGTYGDLTIDTAGNWTYTADNTQAAIQQLDVSEFLTDTLTVTSFDGTTHNVVITINGSEDAAVISGTTTGSVTEDGTLTSSGLLTISDTDSSDTPSFADVGVSAGDNGYGTFEMTAGTWTYTLDNSNPAVQALDVTETLTDTFTFSATDGSSQLVTVTINGAEDAPVFDSTAVTAATEDSAYSYTITTSDADVESVTITAPTLPAWLTLVDNGDGTATLSGTPTNAEVGNHNVVLNVSDGTLSSNQSFTITVANVNNAPVIGGIDTGVVTEDRVDSTGKLTATGALTLADPDIGQSNFVAQTIQGNFGALTIDTSGNWSYSADNSHAEIQALQEGEAMIETLTVTTADGSTHDVEIIIKGSAEAPPEPPPPEEPPPDDEPPADEPPDEVEEVQGETVEDPILEEIVGIPQDTRAPVQEANILNFEQTDEPDSEPVNYGPAIDKQTDRIQEQPQAIKAQKLNIDSLTLQVSDDEALNEQYELELLDRIDSMHRGMDNDAAQQNAEDVDVQIFVGTTTGLTVGIVSWVLRGGALLASLMSTVPLLNRFDPLPILKAREEKEDLEPDENEDESTRFREHVRKVDNMFSADDDQQQ